MDSSQDIPQHLSSLADILGSEVDVATLDKLHALSNGDLNRAINHFYEGTYLNATNPNSSTTRSPFNSGQISSASKRTLTLAGFGVQHKTHGSNSKDGQNQLSDSSKRRKVHDSFFPKYLGEITIIAYALGGLVKAQAGDTVCFVRSKPSVLPQTGGRKKPSSGWGGKGIKENNVVRFTTQKGFEIGRLQVDTARWVSKLMDFGLAEFQGSIIYTPPILSTGAEIVLSMRCYLTAAAFSTLEASNKLLGTRSKQSMTIVNDSLETEYEVELKNRKFAVNLMFKELDLAPISVNNPAGPRDRSIEVHSATPEPATGNPAEDGDEKEEEQEVSDKELDVLYEKAQQHGREFAPMDPPKTLTYTLKPYQRQALAWMYHKECLESDDNEHKTLHPLWEEYEFKTEDGHIKRPEDPTKYYFNPYSGEISLEFPTSDKLCRGGILADEMGLGKTIEILSLVHSNKMDRSGLYGPDEFFSRLSTSVGERRRLSPTTLIVCPMSLISQWRDEAINSSDGSLRIEVYYGGTRDWDDETLLQRDAPDVLITSYGTVLSEYSGLVGGLENGKSVKGMSSITDIMAQNDWKKGSALFNVEFHRVVLDEAHHIKSRMTKTAKACYALSSSRRWVVTGTPIQNKLEDLFSLVHFLRVEPWSDFSFWRTFVSIPFESKDKDKALKILTSVLEPLVLRRTKSTKDENGDPIVMLPERTVEIEYLTFSEQENDIYQALFKDGKTKFNHYCQAGSVLRHYASIFQLLMRMRQVCDHPYLFVGKSKSSQPSGGPLDVKDGPIQLEELMAKFSEGGEPSFGANVLHNLMSGAEVLECPVCFEDMADGVLMPCMHAACRTCVLDYLQRRDNKGEVGECPVCRQGPISEDDLIEYSTSSAPVKDEPAKTEEGCSDFVAGNVLGSIGIASDVKGKDGEGTGTNRVLQIRRNNFKSSAKLDALMRHLNSVRKQEPTTKSVVFSQFTGMLDLAEAILERDGFQFLRLDGTHSQASREKTLEAFKNPDHPALVMLISLRAGGVGLNLTTASRVYMLDPWWNYAIESQAIDRVHRIGQTKPVVVKRFIVQDTVEEKILSIQNRKNALASGLGMTKDESQNARMEDLQVIFS
ncbi:DNA helicase rad5 [Lunasporangiospora selenospora]|uniref:DNA helicase rad5 n=1 Tax=Lunasporangiospora selenospora TaxID=979761 RepID=A0A9P6KFR8_9FUNG|nr:DNA helicase rad5 [Lunasporangiospora selenospora]